eukprot:882-Prymnesium_polylepis.1
MAWGAACQVIGVTFAEEERPTQLSRIASASRFGATLGSMFFGALLKAGYTWRNALMPIVPMQVWPAAATLHEAATRGRNPASLLASRPPPCALAAERTAFSFW